jgi:flagellar hook-associated protein 1 FlgK
MSINQALHNAFSGLTAQSRRAELVARNVANASVDGYAAREARLTERLAGPKASGVRAELPTRAGDPAVTASRRRVEADAGRLADEAANLKKLSELTGPNGPAGALAERYAVFETALRSLADRPESPLLQESAVEAASGLAKSFNAISNEATRHRNATDGEVRRQVNELNRALKEIASLNREIRSATAQGVDATGLEDERDRQIDVVNGIVPIRAQKTEHGGMDVRAPDGTLLAGTYAAELTPPAAADGAIALNGPSGNVLLADAGAADRTTLDGGTLEAARGFAAQADGFAAELDALAIRLAARFEGVAGATPAGEGLFTFGADPTDVGAAPAPADAAARLKLNERLAGAGVGLIQQGLDLVAPATRGPADATAPRALLEAFMRPLDASGGGDPSGRDAFAEATAFASDREALARRAETDAAARRGAVEGLREAELAKSGVDTDAQLAELMAIEKAYAANARVLQVADEMLARLVEM